MIVITLLTRIVIEDKNIAVISLMFVFFFLLISIVRQLPEIYGWPS